MSFFRRSTRGWTLRRLTLFYVMLGIVLTALLDTVIYCTISVRTLNAEIDRRHTLLTQSIANVIETAWRTDNFPMMVQLVDSMRAQGDVEQVVVTDVNNIVVVASDPALTGHLFKETNQYEHDIDVSSLGKLHLQLAAGQTEAFLAALLWRGLLATAFALALLSVILHRPQRNLLKAFEGAVDAAEKLSSGNFEVNLTPHSIVEFNSLHASLNNAASQIKQLTSNLREEVENANAAVEAKDRFLANISHELRTPMNGVLGIAQLMETAQLPAEQKLQLDTLRRCSESLLTVLNDLIDFARIDAGNESLRLSDTQVVNLVEDVVEMMSPQADSKGLELVFFTDIPYHHAHFVVDAARLRQIIYTVIAFSISQTQEGRVTISLKVNRASNVSELTLDVNDTGHGMSSKELHKILDPFQQVGDYKSVSGGDKGGLNLGLALSRRLAMLMGGTLHAETQVGKGTHFTVVFRADRVASPPLAAVENSPVRGKKVLVITHPQHLTGQSLKQTLIGLGCEVSEIAPQDSIDAKLFHRVFVVDDGRHPEEIEQICKSLSPQNTVLIRPRVLCAAEVHSLQSSGIPQLARPVRTDSLIKSFSTAQTTADTQNTGITPGIVLVVEDIETNRMVIKKLLERDGWEVHIAEHGEEALVLLDNGLRPLIVLMDLQMPVMDGFEATQEIRARERRGLLPHQTIYAVTASTSREDADRCINAGMDALIPKPFKMAEFRQVLLKVKEQPATTVAC